MLHWWLVTARLVADANSQNQFTASFSALNANWYVKPHPHWQARLTEGVFTTTAMLEQ